MKYENELRNVQRRLVELYKVRDTAVRRFLLANRDKEASKVFARLVHAVGVVPALHWYKRVYGVSSRHALNELRLLAKESE